MTYLIENLKKLIKKEKFSAHMPGHGYKAMHPLDWYQIDTTEIDGADNLFDMQGMLLESARDIAHIYGALQSRLLVGGSSSGILASIMAIQSLGDTLLVPSDAHKSVFNGIELAGLKAVKFDPMVSRDGVSLGYDAAQITALLKQHPDIRCALLTMLTYYGYITDIRAIADELAHRQGVLIVDEAHGAHLNFTAQKGAQALNMGADIVIQSAHKTLPSLTQSAMLHFGRGVDEALIRRVDKYLEMLQTSSPSYVLMASTDFAVKYLHENSHLYTDAENMLVQQSQSKAFLPFLNAIRPHDIFKWWLNAEDYGYTGYDLAAHLKSHGIYCEFATRYGVLLYFGVNITEDDIQALARCLKQLPKKAKVQSVPYQIIRAARADVEGKAIQAVNIEQAKDKIIAERVIMYPPGTVLIDDGDVISGDILNRLIELKESGHTVMGVDDQTLNTVRVYI